MANYSISFTLRPKGSMGVVVSCDLVIMYLIIVVLYDVLLCLIVIPCMSKYIKQHIQHSVGMTSYLKEKIRRPEGKEARDSQRGD